MEKQNRLFAFASSSVFFWHENFFSLYQKSAPPHQETFVSTLLALRSYRHQFSVLPKSEDETLAFSPAISPAPSFAKAKHLLPGGGSEEAAERPDAGCAEHARRAALAVEGHGAAFLAWPRRRTTERVYAAADPARTAVEHHEIRHAEKPHGHPIDV